MIEKDGSPQDDKDASAPVSRRKFIQATASVAAAGSLASACATGKPAATSKAPAFIKKIEPSDTINLGYVGVGVRGKQHMRYTGFSNPKDPVPPGGKAPDPVANLPRPLNVRAHAVSDCFTGNLEWAKGAAPGITAYPKYEDLLNDKNVDGIFIGTSDHNHAPIGIAAAQAGKHIYSEKSFANDMAQAIAYRDAVKHAGVVFQLGHQTRSGTLMGNAGKAIGGIGKDGVLGKVTLIETYTNRNNPNGAWIYKIPAEANANNIDWEAFTGDGPKREFDLDRFFRFRKYWDYGTGQAGDLLTHEMDAVQQITGLGIPDTCVASGGIFVHKDGRETPDVFNVVFHYEKEEVIVTYDGTLANGKERERTIFGRDATLDMTNGIKIVFDKDSDKYADRIAKGEWMMTIGNEKDGAVLEQVKAQTMDTMQWTFGKGIYIEIIDGKEINVTALHALNFVETIRGTSKATNCGIDLAFEEAVVAHMSTQAYLRGTRVRWDAKNEKIVNG